MPVTLWRTSTVSESGRGEQQKCSPECAAIELLPHCITCRELCVQLKCDIPVPTEAMLLLDSVAGSVICTLTVSVTLAAVDCVPFVL